MEKENLLEKGFWHLADIRAYACCGTVKASKIRQEAIKKYDGLNPLFPTKVRRDAVLKVLDTFFISIMKGLQKIADA